MVERYKRGKGKRKLLGNHQRCWIWGKNTVTETLRAGRWPIYELYLADDLPADARRRAVTAAERTGVLAVVESAEALTRRCRSGEHQGYLAKMGPFPYQPAETLLAEQPELPLYAILDSLHDPYNFGAVLRSAEAMGVDGVFIRSSGQVGVTSLVARSSAGAVNHLPLARVADLEKLVRTLQQRDVAVIAAVAEAEQTLFDCDLRRGTALIIGNEGGGIDPALLKLADGLVAIPQSGRVGSLNAAVASGILFYEARRQRSLASAAESSSVRTARRRRSGAP